MPFTCTVCIANYNGEDLLESCLESVFAQEFAGTIQVIVHDDASTDRSLALLSKWPDVELIASEMNVGFCVANNRMVAASRGRFVLLLNNDATLLPDALATLLCEAERRDAPAILTLPQYDFASGELVDRGCLLDPFYNPVPVTNSGVSQVAMTIGACLWLPRSLWNALGGFPEWIGSIGEDLYLCCAARQRGYEVACTDESGYRHRQGHSFGGNRASASGLSTTFRRRALSERNKTFALAIFSPGSIMAPLLAAHLLTLCLEGFALCALRRDRRILSDIYIAAVISAWRQRHVLAEYRKAATRARTIGARRYFATFTWMPRKLVMLRRHGVPMVR